MISQAAVRWIFTKVRALLGQFESFEKPQYKVSLCYGDLTVALFTKELIDLFETSQDEKTRVFLSVIEELYGNESGSKLYDFVFLKSEQVPFDRTKDDLAVKDVIAWFKSEREKGQWPFIFHYSKNLIDNPLVVSVVNNRAIDEKTDLFWLHSRLRTLKNKWRGNNPYEINSLRLLLKIVLSDLYPQAVHKDSDYVDGSQVPFVVQALCVWWLMPPSGDFSDQKKILPDFSDLWDCLWIDPNDDGSMNIQLAGQYILNSESVLFSEPQLRDLVDNLDIISKIKRVDISNPETYSLEKLNEIRAKIHLLEK